MVEKRVVVPDVVRAEIAGQVRRLFAGRGAEAVRAAVDGLPREVPEGVVLPWIRGGPFGWRVDARLDVGPDGLELEELEDSRMAGPQRRRILADGSVVHLEAPSSASVPARDATPEQCAAARTALGERNDRIAAELRERGF